MMEDPDESRPGNPGCMACGRPVGRYTATCPSCGAPQPQKRAGSTLGLAGILAALLVLALIWMIGAS